MDDFASPTMQRQLSIMLSCLLIVIAASGCTQQTTSKSIETSANAHEETGSMVDESGSGTDEEAPVPEPTTATSQDVITQPGQSAALGGYDVLIADRGNNRLIEVTPQKQIVWVYQFDLPKKGLGADDAFFTDSGKTLSVNLEEYHTIQLIDYVSKQVTWSYGEPGKYGSAAGRLHTPDDAYKLPNGDIIIADIKNCRVIEITPDKRIVHQYGQTKKCGNGPGLLNLPNGDTPLPNGHILISNIVGRSLVELDGNWQPVFTMTLPVRYPSDPQLTKAGNILISDYSKKGKIVEVSRQGAIVWQYGAGSGETLKNPSLAVELPDGNILANDDLNHRVIVIDKQTKQIVWQYGVTGKPGSGGDQLNTPDGVDIIRRSAVFIAQALQMNRQSSTTSVPDILTLHTIGQVTRHARGFIGEHVRLQGYLLKREKGYLLFSDEAGGPIGRYDLPVTGSGLEAVILKQKYILEGTFLDHVPVASNGNPDHVELSAPPQPAP